MHLAVVAAGKAGLRAPRLEVLDPVAQRAAHGAAVRHDDGVGGRQVPHVCLRVGAAVEQHGLGLEARHRHAVHRAVPAPNPVLWAVRGACGISTLCECAMQPPLPRGKAWQRKFNLRRRRAAEWSEPPTQPVTLRLKKRKLFPQGYSCVSSPRHVDQRLKVRRLHGERHWAKTLHAAGATPLNCSSHTPTWNHIKQ